MDPYDQHHVIMELDILADRVDPKITIDYTRGNAEIYVQGKRTQQTPFSFLPKEASADSKPTELPSVAIASCCHPPPGSH